MNNFIDQDHKVKQQDVLNAMGILAETKFDGTTNPTGLKDRVGSRPRASKLIDYTKSRNPNYNRENSLREAKKLNGCYRSEDDDNTALSMSTFRSEECLTTLNDSPLQVPIPKFRSIDLKSIYPPTEATSADTQEEERIEFMFKVKQKRHGASRSSLDSWIQELQGKRRHARQPRHIKFFSTTESTETRMTNIYIPRRHHSAPGCLQRDCSN